MTYQSYNLVIKNSANYFINVNLNFSTTRKTRHNAMAQAITTTTPPFIFSLLRFIRKKMRRETCKCINNHTSGSINNILRPGSLTAIGNFEEYFLKKDFSGQLFLFKMKKCFSKWNGLSEFKIWNLRKCLCNRYVADCNRHFESRSRYLPLYPVYAWWEISLKF